MQVHLSSKSDHNEELSRTRVLMKRGSSHERKSFHRFS